MVRQQVMTLKEEVINKKLTYEKKELFAGAHLVITDKPVPIEEYEGDIVVTTTHARKLSELVFVLKDIFAPKLNAFNKFAFYGRLGEAANKYLKLNSDDENILLAVLDEALRLAEESE